MNTPVNFVPTAAVFDILMLQPRTRNQVRAVLSVPFKESVRLLNKIRNDKRANEILLIERVLRNTKRPGSVSLPDLFPSEIQTTENYYRLCALSPIKQFSQINSLLIENLAAVEDILALSVELGRMIVAGDFSNADKHIDIIVRKHGYSNFILRKAILIRSLNSEDLPLVGVDDILEKAGVANSNFIASSILRCYEEEQSMLSLKRSLMGVTDKKGANKFTRDMTRVSFHPHALDLSDLGEMVQSNLQSSLIDALIILKVNREMLPLISGDKISRLFDDWDACNIKVDEISAMYIAIEDGESLFYKHSSAWLEHDVIVKYRRLQDHFYDDPASNYFIVDDRLMGSIGQWVAKVALEDVATEKYLTVHDNDVLKQLESDGNVTRSSVFNYLTHVSGGHASISEESLYTLMGKTYDLAKTTNIIYLKNLAKYTDSSWAQLVYYLLVAKRSGNEVDDHRLRKLIEKLVRDEYAGDLIAFIDAILERSKDVAIFAYEVFTADFISKLTRIIKSSAQITETRAALHRWMGKLTGEKVYLDRARTLLIDHKINLVRNELDDNRIYVDAARFDEWINDELVQELNMLFTSMVHSNSFADGENDILMQSVEKAYFSFCSNNKFGIASYLGRRIRHGTFKGHLYSGVVGVENLPKFARLFEDPQFVIRWQQWKLAYESKIDDIIRHRLHIESKSKREGLMKPTAKGVNKQDIAIACAKSLVKHYIEHKSTIGFSLIFTEYCWRIAEVDLRSVSSYLKGQKTSLLMQDLLYELSSSQVNRDLAKDFGRELTYLINEKLKTMHGWFKKPVSVAPKASLSLLYRAVVAEVKLYFPALEVDTEYEENEDVEIMGGAYHVLYDALYVVVYNAAKHGRAKGLIERSFEIQRSPNDSSGVVVVRLSSEIAESACEALVNERLQVLPGADIDNAQLSEERSGIRKLHQLQSADLNFNLLQISCENRRVSAVMSYNLEHIL